MSTTQQSSSPIGRDTQRIDGPRKVTGLAQYTSDFNFPGMLYALPVEATIANGKLLTLDTPVAENVPERVFTASEPKARLQSNRGDAEAAFANAPVKLDETYVTPAETHNPLELHATTAIWEGQMLTLYDSTQGVVNLRSVLAQMFG